MLYSGVNSFLYHWARHCCNVKSYRIHELFLKLLNHELFCQLLPGQSVGYTWISHTITYTYFLFEYVTHVYKSRIWLFCLSFSNRGPSSTTSRLFACAPPGLDHNSFVLGAFVNIVNDWPLWLINIYSSTDLAPQVFSCSLSCRLTCYSNLNELFLSFNLDWISNSAVIPWPLEPHQFLLWPVIVCWP